jgi:hypothetical protein
LGELKIVHDFLPKPEALVFKKEKEEKVQITLSLSKVSFEFFKSKEAPDSISGNDRHLLDSYAAQQSHS